MYIKYLIRNKILISSELSEDLNENLHLAKSSLDDCRILVELRLIQITGLHDLGLFIVYIFY